MTASVRSDKKKTDFAALLFIVGVLLIVLSLLVRIVWHPHPLVAGGMVGGALLYTLSLFVGGRKGLPVRVRRLYGMAFLGGVLLMASGIADWLQASWWGIALLVGAVFFIYSNLQLSVGAPTQENEQ